jgi:hypothetical protein
MVGYYGWTMERATANDAFVPILADGLKWMGNSPSGEFLWSIGWFGDRFSEKETFNRFDTQVTLRGVWLPLPADTADDSLLHVGLGLRWAKSNDGFFAQAVGASRAEGRGPEPAAARVAGGGGPCAEWLGGERGASFRDASCSAVVGCRAFAGTPPALEFRSGPAAPRSAVRFLGAGPGGSGLRACKFTAARR